MRSNRVGSPVQRQLSLVQLRRNTTSHPHLTLRAHRSPRGMFIRPHRHSTKIRLVNPHLHTSHQVAGQPLTEALTTSPPRVTVRPLLSIFQTGIEHLSGQLLRREWRRRTSHLSRSNGSVSSVRRDNHSLVLESSSVAWQCIWYAAQANIATCKADENHRSKITNQRRASSSHLLRCRSSMRM
jgi:hypothetical protein